MNKVQTILNSLSNKELIEIAECSSLLTIPEEHIIRKIASEVFECSIDNTTIMQFNLIWINLDTVLADRLKSAIYVIETSYNIYTEHKSKICGLRDKRK